MPGEAVLQEQDIREKIKKAAVSSNSELSGSQETFAEGGFFDVVLLVLHETRQSGHMHVGVQEKVSIYIYTHHSGMTL